MAPWLLVALSVVAVLVASIAFGFARASIVRRNLSAIAATRNKDIALSTCIAAFQPISESRVRAAYAWTQSLVPFDGFPIQADDDLLDILRMDQGNIDDKIESSRERLGMASHTPIEEPERPLRTVKDLMAFVLAYGYDADTPSH